MNLYQSPEQAAAAQRAQAELAALAATLGPEAMWRPSDPIEVERKQAEAKANQQAEKQAQRAQEVEASRKGALFLGEFSASAYLSTITKPAFGDVIPPAAMQIYRTTFLRDAKVTGDPIEKAMIEQYLLVHHTACKLLGLSCDLTNATVISEIGGVAARFLAEARKLALAIQDYRQRATLAAERNEQTNADGQAPTNDAPPATAGKKNKSGARLGSNGDPDNEKDRKNGRTTDTTRTKSASRCRRPAKSAATWQDNGGRPRTPAAKRAPAQTVGALNGASVRRG